MAPNLFFFFFWKEKQYGFRDRQQPKKTKGVCPWGWVIKVKSVSNPLNIPIDFDSYICKSSYYETSIVCLYVHKQRRVA